MPLNQITCPHCGKAVSVDEALSHQIKESLTKEFENNLIEERAKIEKDLKEKLVKQSEQQLKVLEQELEDKDKRLEEAQKLELELRKQRKQLEDSQKEFDLKLQRQLDEERNKIKEEAQKQLSEEYRLKEMEKDKRLSDALKANEELRRKLEQGSQQLQGEILELDLESTLRSAFPSDTIEAVGKGVRGADLKQTVKTARGNICGIILWESKRTKAWASDWTTKLKEDLRAEKADLAVIASSVLPKEMENKMGAYDGVWVCQPDLIVPVSELLRKSLIDTAKERYLAQNRGEKADTLFSYIASPQFLHQVEALAEVYQDMHLQILKERAAFEKIWKTREGQVRRLMTSTANVIGDIKGIVGQSFPSIKGVDLLELDEGEN